MIEPVTVASSAGKLVLGKAASTAGGKFVDKAYKSASKWLKDKFGKHSQKVQKKAKQNTESFLEKAGKSVKLTIQNSQNNPISIQIIDKNFSDPDFSAVLQESVIASARTSSEEKHELLARIISERVLSKPNRVVPLVSSMAIKAVKDLSSKHLYFLGLCSLIYDIRPRNLPQNLPKEPLEQVATEWWSRRLKNILPKAQKLNDIDIRHLESVNCIKYESFIGRDLVKIMQNGFGEWNAESFLDNYESSKKLKKLFEETIQKLRLTSLGSIIGIYVHDLISKQRTKISW